MWALKGSTSGPSSATIKGTRLAMSPLMKATSRLKSVELGDHDRALLPLGGVESALQLGSEFERVSSLAGLDLEELAGQVKALGLGKADDRLSLSLEAEAAFALAVGGYAEIGDDF